MQVEEKEEKIQKQELSILSKLLLALIRTVNWILTHTVYQLKVEGSTNIPREGGALLVANHVSFMDACLIQAVTPRPIRFLMYREYYDLPIISPIVKAARVIPISTNDNPKELLRSLGVASQAIEQGELVCIFAEGELTRIGNMLPFGRGFERIMRSVGQAPIIPVNLDQIWGSIFSFKSGRFFWKFPERLPYPVQISFGEKLPGNSRVFQVRQAIQELSCQAFKKRIANDSLLSTVFLKAARRHFQRPIVADTTGKDLTYGKLAVAALSFAAKLKNLLGKEDKVGLLLPASVPGVLTNLSLTLLGKVPVNLNWTVSEQAFNSAIAQAQIKTILTSRSVLEKLEYKPDLNYLFVEDLIIVPGKIKSALLTAGVFLFPLFFSALYLGQAFAGPNDLATIIFSSGSTGEPKGVMLSHANIVANVISLRQVFKLTDQDCMVAVLPFFHSFGFTGSLWMPILSALRVVYHANPLDAATVGSMTQKYSGTILISTPSFLLSYLRKCTKEQFSTLRTVIVGAEKLKDKLAQAFYEKFALQIYEGYGCTELSPVAILNLPSYSDEKVNQVGFKPGSVGQPIPGVAVRVVDPDSFETLGPDQAGLLLVQGANLMLGYLNQPEKTAQVIVNNWYNTGDIAKIDQDGFVTITDRMSRFSKIGGEMVPHIRIEQELLEILNTNEQVCFVLGVPDEKKGERLCVLCKTDFDSVELVSKLSERGLPNLWIPKKENFFRVEEFPVLGTGKLDLKGLKELALKLIQNY